MGGLVGAGIGAGVAYVAPYISSFAASSFTIGGGFSLSGGAVAVSAGITVTGTQILVGAGAIALGLNVLFSKGADRYKSKDTRSNKIQNEEFKRACDQYNLNQKQRDRLHRIISKRGYTFEDIIKKIIELFT